METNNDGWTLQAFKEYVEGRFEEQKLAINKAELALDYRLEGMNQFRAQIERERGQFITVDKFDQLDDKIDEIRRNYVSQDVFNARSDAVFARLAANERWQNKMVGALALVALGLPIVSAMLVYWTSH